MSKHVVASKRERGIATPKREAQRAARKLSAEDLDIVFPAKKAMVLISKKGQRGPKQKQEQQTSE